MTYSPAPSSPSTYYKSSDGQLYKRTSQGVRRCLPDGTILPRIRMSKKLRLKLKRHQCSPPSSIVGSASPQSTSLA